MAVLVLIAVAVLGVLLLGAVLTGKEPKLASNNVNQQKFARLREALVQFAMVNHRLPCPASGTTNVGIEDVVTAGVCNSPSGVPPWTTLGLNQEDGVDSWGRMFGYRVYDGATGFTRTGGLELSNCLDSDVSTAYALSGPGSTCNSSTHENTRSDFFSGKGLTVNDHGTAKSQIAYVLVSFGETGLGAYLPYWPSLSSAPTPMAAPLSPQELANAGSLGTYWILDPTDPSIGADAINHFDDGLSYALASEVATSAQTGGKPWALSVTFDRVSITGSAIGPLTATGPKRIADISLGTSSGPVVVTPFATASPQICVVSSADTPSGYAIGAASSSCSGDETLTTSNNEGLTVDFRVKRNVLRVRLSDFNTVGGHAEQAQFTFFDGSTQVAQLTKAMCSGDTSANFTMDIRPNQFTRVDIQALNRAGTGAGSDFEIGSMVACKDRSDDTFCPLPIAALTTCP